MQKRISRYDIVYAYAVHGTMTFFRREVDFGGE
jgi:hypothetical protein